MRDYKMSQFFPCNFYVLELFCHHLYLKYNSQYTKYEKDTVTGIEVKECILEVLHSNANTKNDAVFVTGVEVHNTDRTLKYVDITVAVTGVKRALPNDYPLSYISNVDKYTTEIIVGDDGLVQNIIFKIK